MATTNAARAEWRLLNVISEKGSVRFLQLRNLLIIEEFDPVAIRRGLKRLQRKGLVEKYRLPGHHPSSPSLIRLTPAGELLIENITLRHLERIADE